MPGQSQQPANDRNKGRANSLGLNDKVLNEILDYLDGTQSAEAAKRRRYTRIQYRRASVVLAVKTPGGIDTVTKVACRNLSSGGISVLHSAFLHAGSVCVVVLEHPLHGNTAVRGKVARCQHRSGLMHEIGIRFDEQINPRDFVETESPVLTLESVHPDKMTGTVVHFSPDAEHRQAIRDLLRETPVLLKSVSSSSDLLQQIALGVDAVLFQPASIENLEPQISELQQRTRCPICVVVPAATHPLTLSTGDMRILSLAWPTTAQTLTATLAEMLLVLAPGAVKDSVNQNDEVMGRIASIVQTLPSMADSVAAGQLAKALSEISRLSTLIARHDLVDISSRARSVIVDLSKPDAQRLHNILKPVLTSISPPAPPSSAAA